MSKKHRPQALDYALLEERVLLSASPIIVVEPPPPGQDSSQEAPPPTTEGSLDGATSSEPAATEPSGGDAPLPADAASPAWDAKTVAGDASQDLAVELVLVDPAIDGYQQLVDELLTLETDTRRFDVLTWDAGHDLVAQVGELLSTCDGLTALHLIAPGDPGDWGTDTTSGMTGSVALADQLVTLRDTVAPDVTLYLRGIAETADGMSTARQVTWTLPPGAMLSPDLTSVSISDPAASRTVRHEIAFVDTEVADYQTLVDSILSTGDAARQIEVILLDSERDGMQQVTDILSQRTDLSAVHFVTHAAPGAIRLGATWLTADNLSSQAPLVAAWANALTGDADLLFYGCELANGSGGQDLLAEIGRLTGADVAASLDDTGSAAYRANWNLEFALGQIETQVAVAAQEQELWSGLLSTFTVTNTNDSGAGSLRQALLNANSLSGADTIAFNILGTGPHTINVLSALPTITEAVTIDGWTEPDYSAVSGTPVIVLNGAAAGSTAGLRVQASNVTIRGLTIQQFVGAGISLESGTNNIVQGNYLGTNAAGTAALGNGGAGIQIQSNSHQIINNLISGNTGDGVTVTGASGTILQGNRIGVTAAGTAVLGNQGRGIAVNGASNTLIGGLTLGAGNTIGGNAREGIWLVNGTTGTLIQGNWVGSDSTGSLNLGNLQAGIRIGNQGAAASNNVIGGTTTAARNLVAFNGEAGIAVDRSASGASVNNALLGNSIFSNVGLGIDLDDAQSDTPSAGVTANDVGDADTGGNALQNYPVLYEAVADGTNTLIAGSLASTPLSTYRIEFFSSNSGDGTGFGEGRTYLGATTVTTNAAGEATFTLTLAGTSLTAGQIVSATATVDLGGGQFGSTSEFAANVTSTVVSPTASADAAIWRSSGDTSPNTASWNGTTFGATGNTANAGEWRIIDGAESPTRDEKIVIGVNSSGTITGEMYANGSWTTLPFTLGTASSSTDWGFDVVYEAQSGRALLAWNNGTTGTSNVSYRIWDGTSWSGVQTITAPLAGEARHLQLAADPKSNKIALLVTNAGSDDYAMIWDGSSWGNGIILGTTTSAESTDSAIAFEGTSGQVLVVYDNQGGGDQVAYRTWNGTSWSAESSLSPPSTLGDVVFASLASDPGSDRIALSVVTRTPEVWLAVWDGNGWGSKLIATTNGSIDTAPSAAVAFESGTGNLVAVYGENSATSVRYRTWTTSGGWSAAATGPSLGGVPNSLTLTADPMANQLMLSVQDANRDLHFAPWNGTAWGTVQTLELNSGETAQQPFLFLYDTSPNVAPQITSNGGGATAALSIPENTTAITTVTASDANRPVQQLTFSLSGGADAARFAIGPSTGILAFVAPRNFESPSDANGDNVYEVIVQVSDGSLVDTQTLSVTVGNINEAPDGTDATVTVTEDTSYAFSAADFGFRDLSDSPANALAAVKITSLPVLGSLRNNGVAVTVGQSIAVADIQAGRLQYQAATNANGTAYAQLTFQVQDNGGTAAGGVDLDPVPNTLTFNVTAVNDPPAISGPTLQTISNNVSLTLGSATGNALVVSDVDAAASPVRVTLTASQGTLSLATTANLSFTAGDGTADATMTFSGTVTAVNAALDGLQFLPATGYTGTGTLQIDVNDQGNTGSGANGTASHLVLISITSSSLWMSTTGDASSNAGSGGVTWGKADIVDFDHPNLSLGTGTTTGTFSKVFNLDTFAADGQADINGLHFVNQSVTVGTVNAVTLQAGDVLFSISGNETLGGVAVTDKQIIRFRPTNPGDYSSGTFSILIQSPGGTNDHIRDFTLVEAPISVAGTNLQAGDFLLTLSSAAYDKDISWFRPTNMATSPTGGTFTEWLDGQSAGLGFQEQVYGLELVTRTVTIGGQTLAPGQILVSLAKSDNVGSNSLAVTDGDIFLLNVTATGTGTSAASATMLFRNSDVGLTGSAEVLDAIALVDRSSNAPVVTLTGGTLAYTENDAATVLDGAASVADVDSSNFGGGILSVTFSANGTADDRLAIRHQGTGVGQIGVSGSNVTYAGVTIGTFTGGTDGFTPLTITLNTAATAAATQALIRNLTFQNVSDNPSTSTRTVSLILTDGDGGASNIVSRSVAVTAVNDAPTVTIPVPQSVLEDGTLTLSSVTTNPVTIQDVDAGNTPVRLTLTIQNGVASLASTSGLSFLSGDGIDDVTMQFTGSATAISAALDGLVFRPTGDFQGAANIQFTVNDLGNSGSGGSLSASASLAITVTSVNDAPAGTNTAVTTLEDTPYTFTASDFGFTDAQDSPANSLSAVKITTLPLAGSLTLNGVAVTAGQSVSVASINSGLLRFTPSLHANGTNYASFTFQVQDDGGTALGGVDLDPTANQLTIHVTSVNDAPAGTNTAVTTLEDTPYTFTASDFGFTDAQDSPANSLSAVKITTLPLAGSLTLNGVAVTAGQSVSVASINSGLLRFTPSLHANGTNYASFTFQVQDDGGTAAGGVDLDPTANQLTIHVTSVNDAPAGTDTAVTTLEDTPYTFTASDFGFTDAQDSPANSLSAVKITTLPLAGSLTLNGVAVTAGQSVSVASINSGLLRFTPSLHANGTNYASFTFQVQDDGGTAPGGVDLDPTANQLTIHVIVGERRSGGHRHGRDDAGRHPLHVHRQRLRLHGCPGFAATASPR
ncbi:MAG: DUF4347 domain-containing protein [Pirellulales bacterium]